MLVGGAIITGQFEQLFFLFSIVLIHEMGHILTARYFGWKIQKLTLLPFGGVVEVYTQGKDHAWSEFWVTIAGPLTNAVCIPITLLLYFVGSISLEQAQFFIVGNCAIALFNLLPIYPLDGGKLVQILFSLYYPYKRAILISLYVSVGCLLLLLFMSITYIQLGIQLWLMIPYLLYMIYVERKQLPYRILTFLMSRLHAPRRIVRPTSYVDVPTTYTMKQATDQMYRHRYHFFKSNKRYFGEDRVLTTMFIEKKPLTTFAELDNQD